MMKNPATIKIEIDRFGIVHGPVGALVKPLLSADELSFAVGGPYGVRQVRQPFTWLVEWSNNRLAVPAGAVRRITSMLLRNGYGVEIDDRRRPPELQTNSTLPSELSATESQLLAATDREPTGIYRVSSDRVRIRLIELLCRHFTDARTVIVVGTRADARRLWQQLVPLVPGQVGLAIHGNWPDRRCIITTCGGFEGIDQTEVDVVIFQSAELALGRRPARALARLKSQRIYGILGDETRLGPVACLNLELQYGSIIHDTRMRHADRTPVDVLVCDAPWFRSHRRQNGIDRKRAANWNNERRNDLVARLASAFLRADLPTIWDCGLLLDQAVHLPQLDRPLRVAILVESTEHGSRLVTRLPGWGLESRGTHGTRVTLRSWSGVCDQEIITVSRARQLDQLRTDVLIAASSPESILHIRGFPGTRQQSGTSSVLLVDIADDHDARAARAVRDRCREYVRRGWTVHAPRHWGVVPIADSHCY